MDETTRWAFGILGGGLIAMFGWVFRILGGKANATSTDNRFDEVLEELRQQRNDLKIHETEDRSMHKDVLVEIRETNRHLSVTNATLSNLVGRFEATNGHQRQ